MVTLAEISAAIDKLRVPRSRKGASRYALKAQFPECTTKQVNLALKKGVESGRLIKIGDSFKNARVHSPKPNSKTK